MRAVDKNQTVTPQATSPGWKQRLQTASWRDLMIMLLPAAALLVAVIWAGVKSVRFAPPSSIRFISGPEGSSYRTQAERYKKIIEGYGVKVEILSSRGALDNLQRLADPKAKIDVGFVQGGLTDGVDISRLVSLGSVFAQPLMVYGQSDEPLEFLSQLKGRRLAIGPEGSGTRVLAQKLLKANDIEGPPTELLDMNGEDAAKALAAGTIDAAFLMGDSATPQVMRGLRGVAGVELTSFRQADGYLRKFRFLSKLTLPEGAMDLGKNYPPRTLQLIGPTVELVAREDLHPALSDLLISAAREVHGGAGLFRTAGEYPAPLARDFRISPDAERYYKSGQQFLYKRLPFWLASLVDRLLVVIIPLLVILVPASRIAPALYRWRVRSRVYRWYGALMAIEHDMSAPAQGKDRAAILHRIDEIARAVSEIKTPLSIADQLYVLRDHVATVRRRLHAAPDDAR
jgi:hypothetical protein